MLFRSVPDKNPEINIWMAFPAMASFGMSSLGYMSIVKTLDMRSDYFVEKIFTDTKSPRLMTSQVDVMGFSVSFEIDFLGIFDILEKRSIPLKAKDRTEFRRVLKLRLACLTKAFLSHKNKILFAHPVSCNNLLNAIETRVLPVPVA